MTHLTSLNGSQQHLVFAKCLKNMKMVIHCLGLFQRDDKIFNEIPDQTAGN